VSAQAATSADVRQSGSNYIANIGGVDQATTDFTTAFIQAVGIGDRTVTVSCSGTLSQTVQIRKNTSIDFKSNKITKASGSLALYAYKSDNITINNLNLSTGEGGGIRFSGCNTMALNNITMTGAGIRLDSRLSNPWTATVSGLTMNNISVSNTTEHGVETYSVDNYNLQNMKGNNLGGCAVLINNSKNGIIGTVTGTYCCPNGNGNGGGYYAALRFANDCDGCTVDNVYARNCGRGFFTCTNSKNITLKSVDIARSTSHAILIQTGSNNKVLGGKFYGVGLIDNSPGSEISAKDMD
jgi:hypothetical protein